MQDIERKKLIKLRKRMETSQTQYNEYRHAIMEKCQHNTAIESHGKDGYFGYNLPRRLCCECGMLEESWNWPGHVRYSNFMARAQYQDKCVDTLINAKDVTVCAYDDFFTEENKVYKELGLIDV